EDRRLTTGLRICFGNLRHGFGCFWPLRSQVIIFQAVAQELEAFFGRIYHAEQIEVRRRDGSGIDHRVEVDETFPVLAAVNHHQNFFSQLLGLSQSEDFKQLVQRAKATGEDYQCLGQVCEPELPHEKIVKLEIKRRRDIWIRILLEWQIDVETNCFP